MRLSLKWVAMQLWCYINMDTDALFRITAKMWSNRQIIFVALTINLLIFLFPYLLITFLNLRELFVFLHMSIPPFRFTTYRYTLSWINKLAWKASPSEGVRFTIHDNNNHTYRYELTHVLKDSKDELCTIHNAYK